MSFLVGVLSDVGCISRCLGLQPYRGCALDGCNDNIRDGFDDQDSFLERYCCGESQKRDQGGEGE